MATAPVGAAPDGRRERWVEHRAARRAALVAAAVTAVDNAANSQPTLEDVAQAAGVSRTVLYRYFADLDDVLQAVATVCADDLVARVLEPLADGHTARDIIVSVLDGITEWVERHPRRYLFLRQHAVSTTDTGDSASNADGIDRVEDLVAERLAALLMLFMTTFGMPDRLADLGARSLIGLVESSVVWWGRQPPAARISRAELVATLTTAVWAVIEVQLRAAGVELSLDDPLPDDER